MTPQSESTGGSPSAETTLTTASATALTAASIWRELVSVALLGTDRRDPPQLPDGPAADVVADAQSPDPARRLLVEVATLAAARRAAFEPLPPAPLLQPPVDRDQSDDRKMISPAAGAMWRRMIDQWPVLEDEFMWRVITTEQLLPPDVLVAALARHRRDPVRRARVALAGGPLVGWLDDLVPALASTARPVPAGAADALPELPIPPDLAELLTVDAHTFTRRLLPRFDGFTTAHRPVLINLFARCRPEVLDHAAEALDAFGSALAVTLADLARTRSRMLTALATR